MYKHAVVHSLLFIVSLSLVASEPLHIVRQNTAITPPSNAPTTPTIPSVTTPQTPTIPTTPTTPQTPTVPTTPTSPTTPATTPTTPTTPATTPTTPTTPLTTPTTPTSQSSVSSPTQPTSSQDTTVASTTTDAQGQVQTIIVTSPADSSSSSSSASSASPSSSDSNSDNDSSIKPGAIIGLSVAGGIAAIAVIAFIIWKVTRKRFSDFDEGDEAIKWPELNRDSHIGGTDDLSRQASNTFSSAPSRNQSALDHSEYADPYAVPPLPQFNPNQPYRDDPAGYAGSAAGYYDPYRGPVPQTFHDGSVDGHESIPMSTYPSGARSRSPGPGMAYDTGGRASPSPGRASPGPGMAYDASGRGSPVPGRTISPGPAAALGLDRRPTPNPQYSLGGQPEMVARNKSPGPNMLG